MTENWNAQSFKLCIMHVTIFLSRNQCYGRQHDKRNRGFCILIGKYEENVSECEFRNGEFSEKLGINK